MKLLNTISKQFINGTWRDGASNNICVDLNPYSNEHITQFNLANIQDIDEAYHAAKTNQTEWSIVNPYRKREILESTIDVIDYHKEEIVEIIIQELGGTRLKAEFEISLTKDFIKEAATHPLRMIGQIIPSMVPGKENRIYRNPVGVVAVISPSNFPLILGIKSVASALATGNGVVLKPHENTPLVGGILIARIFEEAGLPNGLLNVIVCDINKVGDAFIEHPIPQVISFTGSVNVGRHIGKIAGQNLKKTVLELGGNSALIILEDANMELAVNAAVFSRFIHQGQVCMSANRVLVHSSLYETFLAQFVKRVSALKVGDPKEPDTVIGPLINKHQADRIKELIDTCLSQGASAALHGNISDSLVEPTILIDINPKMEILQTELFGPLICVIPFDTEDEAIEIANNTNMGLSGAIITKNPYRGSELAKKMNTAMIHINDGTINDEPSVPFGGNNNSGIGRLNSDWSIENFTTLKWISIQHEPRQYPI